MTDINKFIEEYTIDDFERMAMKTDYAVEANEDTCKINEADAGAFYKEGFVAGIKLILHQNRWRKFSTDDLPKIGEQIVCRGSKGHCHLSKPISHDGIHWLAENFTEWKPII